MQPRVLAILVNLLVIAAFAQPAAGQSSGRFDAIIGRYSVMQPAARQQWLNDLLRQRLEGAARVAQSPAEFARQEAFDTAVLQRIAVGRELSDAGLEKLLAAVDQQEKWAIIKLVSQYRQAVQRKFGIESRDFSLRMEAWWKVHATWEAAGGRFDDQPLLTAWLQGAIRRIEADRVALLPAMPRFGNPPRSLAHDRVNPRGPDQSAQIDVDELAVRIAGYNSALATLTGRLQESSGWTIDRLVAATDQLADLTTRRADLALYLDLLPANQRTGMPPLRDPASAVSMLAGRIFAARETILDGASEQPTARDRQLQSLDSLSRRLGEIAVRAEASRG